MSLSTLPINCGHFTLRNPQSYFSTISRLECTQLVSDKFLEHDFVFIYSPMRNSLTWFPCKQTEMILICVPVATRKRGVNARQHVPLTLYQLEFYWTWRGCTIKTCCWCRSCCCLQSAALLETCSCSSKTSC